MSADNHYICGKSSDSPESDENCFEIYDILPLWKLALHAEGAPLILPNIGHKNLNSFNNKQLCEKFNAKDIYKCNNYESNTAKRSSECLFKGNDLFLSHRINRRSNSAQNKFCVNIDQPTIVSVSLKSDDYNCNSDDVSICSSESSSVSIEEVIKKNDFASQQTSKSLLKNSCSDIQSITSEDSSSASDHCLPRVIKPRKRRKKNKYSNQLMTISSDLYIKSQSICESFGRLESSTFNGCHSTIKTEKFGFRSKSPENSNICLFLLSISSTFVSLSNITYFTYCLRLFTRVSKYSFI